MMLRGVGYESNDASVITNVSSDHMDLHGIHTLPELAEVKSVISRITRPDGVAGAQRGRSAVAADVARMCGPRLVVLDGAPLRARPAPPGAGRPAWVLDGGLLVERTGTPHGPSSRSRTSRRPSTASPATTSPTPWPPRPVRARWARRCDQVAARPPRLRADRRAGPRPTEPLSTGRDRGHRRLRPQRGRRPRRPGGRRGTHRRPRPRAGRRSLGIAVGTAGDRPDDTLRGIGRDRRRARRPGGHQGDPRLPARSHRESVVGELRAGVDSGGWLRLDDVWLPAETSHRPSWARSARRWPVRGDEPAGRARGDVPRGPQRSRRRLASSGPGRCCGRGPARTGDRDRSARR